MSVALGVDTGGTYTDAVLIRDEKDVVASAKALTTHHDLALGIGEAVSAVLQSSGVAPGSIGLASLSTTLATNALVEGRGEAVGLVLIGFRAGDVTRHGLGDALGDDPRLVLAGGHNHAGGQVTPLDEEQLSAWVAEVAGQVSGFAVAAQFATRNPAHEQAARRVIGAVCDRPVTCSHELSARLNGPKRAVTAVLNARLIGMIARLIDRAGDTLTGLGVTAPLMVVRGDGALIGAEMARQKPVETILSGPAASIVGARWLTGESEALVSDIGGTTTDIAILRNGRPAIDPHGARVGAHRTMVEAVDMVTHGLGGDSEVHFEAQGLGAGVRLGPQRVLPISLIAMQTPERVIEALELQLRQSTLEDFAGRFVLRVQGSHGLSGHIDDHDAAVFARIPEYPVPLNDVLKTRRDRRVVARLAKKGSVRFAGVTPTDAAHVLGLNSNWDGAAAKMALTLFARQRTGGGGMLAGDAETMAQMVIDQLTEQTTAALLARAFAEEETDFGASAEDLAQSGLMRAALGGHRGVLRLEAKLDWPVIGLGASAGVYYPAVGKTLGARVICPQHAGVANAIGAVVGRITARKRGSVTAPNEGVYRVHLESGPQDLTEMVAALTLLEDQLEVEAVAEARAAGAEAMRVTKARDVRTSTIEGREMFLDAEITVEASGRARIATG